MTVVAYGNGRSTQYEYYDHTRRLKRMLTGGASTIQDIRYTCDIASNILSVTDAAHPGVQVPSCGLSNIVYDDLYRLTSLFSSSENRTITYTYNALGNIVTNGEMGAGTYTYHATRVHAVTAANGSAYTYDAVGNMITRNRSGKPNQTLTYDEQNRLKQVAIAGGNTITFGYSAGGSRLWKKVNGQVTGLWIGNLYEEKEDARHPGEMVILCHVYAGDRLVASFEPASGFACFIQNHPFLAAIWNFGDGVATALFGGGRAPMSVMGLAILAGLFAGRPGAKRRAASSWRGRPALVFVAWASRPWIPNHGQDARATQGQDALATTVPLWRRVILTSLAASVFLSSNPQAAYAQVGVPEYDPVFYYYHPDHLGSSQLMTDRDGDVVQQYGYTPFGKENYKNNALAFPVSSRYTGQTLDEETGLYYYGARYYDPSLGRFIQADSVVPDPGRSHAYNRYTYCYNNPLRLTDPTGNTPTSFYDVPAGDYGGISSTDAGFGDFGFDWSLSFDWTGSNASSASSSTALTSSLTGNPSSSSSYAEYNAWSGYGFSFNLTGVYGGSHDVSLPPWDPWGQMGPIDLSQDVQLPQAPSIGAPGFWGGMIPVYSSVRSAVNDFEEGRYVWAGVNTLLAASDLTGAKTIVTGVGKLVVKGGGRLVAKAGAIVVARRAAKSYVDDTLRAGGEAAKGLIERHHQLPVQFKPYFNRAGLEIEDYVIDMDRASHRLRPDGLHTGQENWNRQWKQFIDANPEPRDTQILDQMGKMRKDFGLE